MDQRDLRLVAAAGLAHCGGTASDGIMVRNQRVLAGQLFVAATRGSAVEADEIASRRAGLDVLFFRCSRTWMRVVINFCQMLKIQMRVHLC